MTIAQDFIKKLQDVTDQQFWKEPSDKATFQDVLDQYATHYQSLSDPSRVVFSNLFWEQVKAIGTPIIEERSDGKCQVYFLFPRNQVADSDEKPGDKKDLYLQGDFHGYDTTDGRQLLTDFKNTGIMLRSDTIFTDAMITYRYIQLEPSLKGRIPIEHHGSTMIEPLPDAFFPQVGAEIKKEVIASQTENASDKFWGKDSQLVDEYSTHRPVFFGVGSLEKILRISAESSRAHLQGEAVNWPRLLSTEGSCNACRKFVYYDALYSDLDGGLKHCAAPITEEYAGPGGQLSSIEDSSPYSQFTRAIHIFKPASEKIDNVVIVNDGIAYLSMGIMDHFETMVKENKLSPNIAFVFITCLPGLAKTVEALDPAASMPGMGERTVDYERAIDAYADFIGKKLLPRLDLELSCSHSNKIMIGSSLSGTASLYMALNRPDLFDGVIAQSPSPYNRNILTTAVTQYVPSNPRAKIHLSCGTFESPGYADNTNFPYAVELSKKLDIPLQSGAHGHQFVAWDLALEQSLPDMTRQQHALLCKTEGLGKYPFFALKRSASLPDLSQLSQREKKDSAEDKRYDSVTQTFTPM